MPTYTTASAVKDLISTGEASHNIVNSEPVDEVVLQHEKTNGQIVDNKDFLFNPAKVTVGADFRGSVDMKIEFTSSSKFDVYENHEAFQNLRLISSGNQKQYDWKHPEHDITIKSGAWGGTVEANDIVKLSLKAYLSDNMIDGRIEDTEVMIDSMIKGEGVQLTEKASDNTRLYQSGSVPDEVSVACKHLAAFYIYTDIYKDKFQDEGNNKFSYVRRWKRRAEDLVETFMEEKLNIAPKMGSFPPVIDTRGTDDDLGPGFQEHQDSSELENTDIDWQDQFDDWY